MIISQSNFLMKSFKQLQKSVQKIQLLFDYKQKSLIDLSFSFIRENFEGNSQVDFIEINLFELK